MGYLFFLALIAALGGLLFGYDTAVISGTIDQVNTQFHLNVVQQGWYVSSALVGSIAGVAVAGWLSDRFGRKPIMFLSAFLFTTSALGCAVATNFSMLVVFRIVGGAGIGIISIVAPIYISEIAIAQYRGLMVSLYQLAITIGFLVAYAMNYGLLLISQQGAIETDWLRFIFVDEVWRGMLGMETLPALFFFIIILALPESPRWLVVKGRLTEAETIYQRIYVAREAIAKQIANTQETIAKSVETSWRSLLQPGLLKAIILGVCIAILGQFMGVNAVLYYGPSIFTNAGMDDPLLCQVLVGAVNMLTTIIALFIIDRIGRKKLIYYGVSGMILSLILIALYFQFHDQWQLSSYMMLAFFLFYVFCCAISISAVVFVLLSEMYPNHVRGIAMSIAGLALWVGTFLIGQLTPWFLSAFTSAGTFLFFALMCLPYLFIIWRFIPETARMSLEDIERYWRENA